MKCPDCKHYDPSYVPERCLHGSNVIAFGGGLFFKETAEDLNPNDECDGVHSPQLSTERIVKKAKLKSCQCREVKINGRGDCIKCGMFRTSVPQLFENLVVSTTNEEST